MRAATIVRLVAFAVMMAPVVALLMVVAAEPYVELELVGDARIDGFISYQLSALPVAALAAVVTLLFARRTMLRYLRLKRTGAMRPLRGSNARASKDVGRWERDGWTTGLVFTAVIGAATFVQVLPGGFEIRPAHLLLVLPLAVSNALVEEVIFRLSFVSVGMHSGARWYALALGSLVFGVVHYWGGMPNGLIGAIASAFLGFVLAKSMLETRGFFWALTIHVMLDVAIFAVAFSAA